MMAMEYRNKVRSLVCPVCGMKRPYDWFRCGSVRCWLCREVASAKKRGESPAKPEPRMR